MLSGTALEFLFLNISNIFDIQQGTALAILWVRQLKVKQERQSKRLESDVAKRS